MALSDTFFSPNRNNCQIYKHRFYWCIFLRTGCRKDAFTSWNLTQKKSFVRIPDGVSSLTVVHCVFPFVFCPQFLLQLLLMQETLFSLFFEMFLFLVFPQLQVFSFNFYLNTDFFVLFLISICTFKLLFSVFTYHLSGPPAKTSLPSTLRYIGGCLLCLWVAQSCSGLCNPVHCGPPAPLSMDFPGRILEYLLFPPPRDLSNPGIELTSLPLHYHCTSWQAPTCSINL